MSLEQLGPPETTQPPTWPRARRPGDPQPVPAGRRHRLRRGGGHEALARGPKGPGHPAALFAAAREHGLLVELDAACRDAAFAAPSAGLLPPRTLFVNVEPEVLDTGPPKTCCLRSPPRRRRTAGRPGDHRASAVRPPGRAVAHGRASRKTRLGRGARRRRGRARVDGADGAAAARHRQARPQPRPAAPGTGVRGDHERRERLCRGPGGARCSRRASRPRAPGRALALGATLGTGLALRAPGRDSCRWSDRQPRRSCRRPRPAGGRRGRLAVRVPAPEAALRRPPKALLVEMSKHLEREAHAARRVLRRLRVPGRPPPDSRHPASVRPSRARRARCGGREGHRRRAVARRARRRPSRVTRSSASGTSWC